MLRTCRSLATLDREVGNENGTSEVSPESCCCRDEDHSVQSRILRDSCIHRLLYDEQKFKFARIMGADFAPKAAEISAAVMGPPYTEETYG